MNKPFFKLDVGDWNSGDIQFLTFREKGVFIDLCSYYWYKDTELYIDKWFRRNPDTEEEMENLKNEEIIIVNEDDKIVIPFLDKQIEEMQQRRKGAQKTNDKRRAKPKSPSNKSPERIEIDAQ